MLCEPTLSCDLALALQIALVANDNHGEVVLVLHTQDLLLECRDLLEALSAGDGVDQKETLASAHVLLTHGRVLLLTGSIENVEKGDLIIDNTLLTVRIWNKAEDMSALGVGREECIHLDRCVELSEAGGHQHVKRDLVSATRRQSRQTDRRSGLGEDAGLQRTFNSRIVLVDEVALDELDGQAGFTNTTASDNHQLVLS